VVAKKSAKSSSKKTKASTSRTAPKRVAAGTAKATKAKGAAAKAKPKAPTKPTVAAKPRKAAKPKAAAPAQAKPASRAKAAPAARRTKTRPASPAPRVVPADVDLDLAPPNGEPVDSGLSPRDVEQFREMLLEKRSQLTGDVAALRSQALGSAEHAGELSRMPLHMADVGSDNFEHEFTLGLIEGERAVLREIEEALDRIDKGTFGICVATGRPIGKARLKAKPWAKYCYEYAMAQEKGLRR
jgi:DnaK suppressor protein